MKLHKVVDLIEKRFRKKWNYNQFVVSSFDWNTTCRSLKFKIANGVPDRTNLALASLFRQKFIRYFRYSQKYSRRMQEEARISTVNEIET
jgi:hypothetical protein